MLRASSHASTHCSRSVFEFEFFAHLLVTGQPPHGGVAVSNEALACARIAVSMAGTTAKFIKGPRK
jgi:aspartyl-tRNA synthetase